jgi:spore germination protein YaaH
MIFKKRALLFALIITLFFTSLSGAALASTEEVVYFSDVPSWLWSFESVNRLRELKIADGIGNNQFGPNLTITRGQFVTFLVRLMGWNIIKPSTGSFSDNMNPNEFYYGPVETALIHNIIKKDVRFRPNDPVSREEMAIMIVRTIGYETLALKFNSLDKPFVDVVNYSGYIMIGKDLGIINGIGGNKFDPHSYAKRDQAAAMMVRMYDKLNKPLEELHAFYAISSSSQIDKLSQLDSASFGWARLEYDEAAKQVVINTDNGTNEYYIPTGYTEVLAKAEANHVSRQLMFFVKDQNITDPATNKTYKLAEYIVTHPEIRKQVISGMTAMVNLTEKYGSSVSFDGLVSDFEGFKGEELKSAYNAFLTELKAELSKTQNKLYVAVHPKRNFQSYSDGYDYKTIGELADKVILMAHDYEATSLTDAEMKSGYTDTPVTPLDEIYYALKSITDPVSGVADHSKIWLQLSMDTVQWQLKDGSVINSIPYHPSYSLLYDRFLKGATLNYSELSQNPYAKFTNEEGLQNVVWYENERSIGEKIKLAKMFGVQGLSLWRLGNIPEYADTPEHQFQLNIWGEIMKNYQ